MADHARIGRMMLVRRLDAAQTRGLGAVARLEVEHVGVLASLARRLDELVGHGAQFGDVFGRDHVGNDDETLAPVALHILLVDHIPAFPRG